jgi:hypothetical protein
MRWLARAALAALGSVVSVFIACAYGTPWRYVKEGRVVDATTGEGIPGIQAGCLLAGGLVSSDLSDGEGRFALRVDSRCDEVGFTDVDGADNGAYAPQALPFTEGDETDLLIELEPAP